MSSKGTGSMDADRQEPRGPLPEGVGLGAIPRTPRISTGMAIPEERLIRQFPVCSRCVPSGRHRKWLRIVGVPGVPRHRPRLKRVQKHLTDSNIYTHDLEQRNSENGQWNQRRTDGTWWEQTRGTIAEIEISLWEPLRARSWPPGSTKAQ